MKSQKMISDNIRVQVPILAIILQPWGNYVSYLTSKLESVHKMISKLFPVNSHDSIICFTFGDMCGIIIRFLFDLILEFETLCCMSIMIDYI